MAPPKKPAVLCADCGVEIDRRSTRCRSCQVKRRLDRSAERRRADGRRVCTHCETPRPASEFSRSRNPSAWCRSCCAANAKAWRDANLESARNYDRLRQDRQRTGKAKEWARFYRWLKRHGLRPEDYAGLFDAQAGRCAICHELPGEGKFLHIDHDHVTGQVRGLLCPIHNMGLGSFGDDRSLLLSAVDYLDRPPAAGVLSDPL